MVNPVDKSIFHTKTLDEIMKDSTGFPVGKVASIYGANQTPTPTFRQELEKAKDKHRKVERK